MTFPDFERKLHHFRNHPLVVAVEFLDGDRWWQGRATEYVEDPAGWHVYVSPELADYKSGATAGWLDLGEVRAGTHPVKTTVGAWEWGTFTPPSWPEPLAFLAEASSNMHERPAPPT